MKKIIALLFLIVNALLFFGVINVYKQKDSTYIAQLEMQRPGVVAEWIAVENNNWELDSQEMLALFVELTNKYDLLISVRLGDGMKRQDAFYLALNENVDEFFELITDVSVNFNETDAYFYTNDEENQDGNFFYLLNKDMEVNIYPISHLGDIPSTMIFLAAGNQQALDASIEVLMSRFGDYLTKLGTPSAEPYIVEDELSTFLPMAIILAMACAFLLLMMYVHTKSKKIAILKTMGTSLFKAGLTLFLPLFVTIVFTIIITNVALFWVFVNTINARTIPIIITLAKTGIYQVLGASLVITLSCFLLALIPAYSLLKNSRLTRYIMNANFALKMLVLLAILPMVSGKLDTALQQLNMIRYSSNPAVSQYQLVTRYKSKYEFDGYDYLGYIQEYIKNKDPAIINSHKILYEYHNAYKILNEAGALFCKSYYLNDDSLGIMVNENYLERYPIKDVNGNFIDVAAINADVVYFVPEYFFDLPQDTEEFYINDLSSNPSYEMVVIGDKQDMFVFDPPYKYEILQRPHIVMLYKDSAFRIETTIIREVYIDADINELLKDTHFNNKITTSTFKDYFTEPNKWLMREVVNELRLIIPTLALVFVMIIQYAYLYLKVYAKRIFVRKIMGHNLFRIYSRLLVESGIVVVVAIISAIVNKTDLTLLFIVLVLEILVYLVIVFLARDMKAKFLNTGEG